MKSVSTPIKVALVYPSTYQASITNLFTHIAYYYLNSFDEFLVDRFTLDNPISSCIHSLNLRSFDIALFSLSYEFDYINTLKIMVENNLRSCNGRSPITIAGGPVVTANPLPISKFFDAIVIGEGEEALKILVDAVNLLPNKRGFLEALSSKGFYVPTIHGGEVINKIYVKELDNSYYPEYQIQSLVEEPVFGRGYIVEVSRGCPYFCSFCMESVVSSPYRVRSYGKVIDTIFRGLNNNKSDRAIFYSLSFFSYPSADKILETLLEEGVKFSIPSVRADTLNEYRLNLIRRGGQKTLTLAPETHSHKLKCLIRKSIDEDHLTRLVIEGVKHGMKVKMYYLLGIPFETIDDVRKIINFFKVLSQKLSNYSLRDKIRITVNPLIPKANTPMQFLGLVSKENYSKSLKILRSEIRGRYFTLEALSHNIAYVQALLSLGTDKLGEALMKYVVDGLKLSDFRNLLKSYGIDTDYVFKQKDEGDRMPWDFINLGVNVRQIYKEMITCLN
ncbi:MAG: radical SAM protein [Sulfolobales archaeon]